VKLLVPVDFSDNALRAAEYALTWANAKRSSVHLLHVIEAPVSDPQSVGDAQILVKDSLRQLSEQLTQRFPHCTITHAVRKGSITDEIDEAARNLNVGLIVMGLHGVSAADRFFFGSNAISLVRSASCPILIVPAAARTSEPHKIVFATDYHDSDLQALDQLLPTARAFNSQIEMVHIFDEDDEQTSEIIMMEAISNEIRKKIDYPGIGFQVYYSSKVSEGIQHFIQQTGADLVVLSARKLSAMQKLFGTSVSQNIIYNASIPILVFHAQRTSDHIMQL
jgi:nucleotide-binding universal stress UspA family protein